MVDQFWREAQTAVAETDGGRVVAPSQFRELVVSCHCYEETPWLHAADIDAVVIHKAQLNEIDPQFLRKMQGRLNPIFANEVFVVFHCKGEA
jgi:hypothetical protein